MNGPLLQLSIGRVIDAYVWSIYIVRMYVISEMVTIFPIGERIGILRLQLHVAYSTAQFD